MVKVKICGVTSQADAEMCVKLGADFIGNIVDIPSSPRSISIEKSREILRSLSERARGIIVMAPQSVGDVKKVVEIIQPWGVQLHGGENLEFVKKFKEEISCQAIKVIHIKGEESIAEALAFSDHCDALLLDTHSTGLGGSGETHNWDISSQIVDTADCKVFLAGGLNPENVRKARDSVAPYCVDVSSGVEAMPGKKDPEKVRRFIEEAKST
jgi:phosphoribosylanthranilate isomerase